MKILVVANLHMDRDASNAIAEVSKKEAINSWNGDTSEKEC